MTEPAPFRRKPYTWAIVLTVVVFLFCFGGAAVALYLAHTKLCIDNCAGHLPPPPLPTCHITGPEASCGVYR